MGSFRANGFHSKLGQPDSRLRIGRASVSNFVCPPNDHHDIKGKDQTCGGPCLYLGKCKEGLKCQLEPAALKHYLLGVSREGTCSDSGSLNLEINKVTHAHPNGQLDVIQVTRDTTVGAIKKQLAGNFHSIIRSAGSSADGLSDSTTFSQLPMHQLEIVVSDSRLPKDEWVDN